MQSFLLRLRSDQLARGELVGEVEDIRTGERRLVRRTAELVDFCVRMVNGASPESGRDGELEGQK